MTTADNKEERAAEMARLRIELSTMDLEVDAVDSYHPVVSPDICFEDGVRQIDYVLAYSPHDGKPDSDFDPEDVEDFKTSEDKEKKSVFYRLKFVSELVLEGLEVEYTRPEKSWDPNILYVKIHIPWESLLQLAEDNHIKMPYKRRRRPRPSKTARSCNKKHTYDFSLFPRRPFHIEIPFAQEKAQKYVGFDQPEIFFRQDHRILMCYSVLSYCSFEEDDDEHVQCGVDIMVEKGILLAAYPLHDGDWDLYTGGCCSTKRMKSLEKEKSTKEGENANFENKILNRNNNQEELNYNQDEEKRYSEDLCRGSLRVRLYEGWASMSHCCRIQPKDYVREYFGDGHALFFVWVGFWIEVTIPVAIIGLLSSLLMIYYPVSMIQDNSATSFCQRNDLAMCPQCDRVCRYWLPTDLGCMMTYLNAYVDNPVPVFVSALVCIWAYNCKELWKKRERRALYEWNLHNQVYVEDIIRPDYRVRATSWKPNYITGRMEPYYSNSRRCGRFCCSGIVLLIMIIMSIAFATAIVIFRVEFLLFLWEKDDIQLHKFSRIIVSACAGVLNVTQCCIMSAVNYWASDQMTRREYHKTDNSFIQALGFKMLIFETFNIYLPMAYIAWLKGRYYSTFWHDREYLYAHPHKGDKGQGWDPTTRAHGVQPLDFCDPAGCLVDICMTTGIYVCVTQFVAVICDFAIPRGMSCFYQVKNKKKKDDPTKNIKEEKNPEKRKEMEQWERDYFLGERDLFYDYMNSVHAFGYTVLFISTFPIAPIFTLFAHVMRLRMAAKGYLVDVRRVRPIRTEGVGFWITAIHAVGVICLFTNTFAIALTSNFCDKLVFDQEFKLTGKRTPLSSHSFHYFRMSRYAISDFAKEAAPIYKPISFKKNPMAFYRIDHDSSQAVCYYVGYNLDPFVHNSGYGINETFDKETVKKINCYGNVTRCPARMQKAAYRYLFKEQYWHVLQMKFQFSVYFILFVYLISVFLSYLIGIKDDESLQGMTKERYQEQEMIFRNQNDATRNKNMMKLSATLLSVANLKSTNLAKLKPIGEKRKESTGSYLEGRDEDEQEFVEETAV